MLRFGPDRGPVVIAAMPLFEEANRTRAFLVTILRALAERGIAARCPICRAPAKVSSRPKNATLSDWRMAFSSAAASLGTKHVHIIALRGGALLDADGCHSQSLAFRPGRRRRARPRSAPHAARARPARRRGPRSPSTLQRPGRRSNSPAIASAVRCWPNSTRPSRRVDGTATHDPPRIRRPARRRQSSRAHRLWRRSEPDNDPALAALLADDIATWITTCDA